jgi:hypothetical protein
MINEQDFFTDLMNPETASRHIIQGSEEWDKIRLTRFTSSEWHKLMDCGKRPMTEAELKARPKTGKGSKTTQVPDPTKMSDKGLKYIFRRLTLSRWSMERKQNQKRSYTSRKSLE